jgi:hypothetical protein
MFKRLLLGCCAILICAQFSNQKSTSAREKPATNVFGTLVDTSGHQTKLENISVNGLVDRIPVYKMPPKKADGTYNSPENNKLLLDLRKVTQISSLIDPNQASAQAVTINNREYVPIVVVFNDKTKQDYIIEKRRRLTADDTSGGGSEREVSFQAVRTLNLEGDKPQDPTPCEQRGVSYRNPAAAVAFVMEALDSVKMTVKNGVTNFFEKIWYTC